MVVVNLKVEVGEVLLALQRLRVSQQVFRGFLVQSELGSLRGLANRDNILIQGNNHSSYNTESQE